MSTSDLDFEGITNSAQGPSAFGTAGCQLSSRDFPPNRSAAPIRPQLLNSLAQTSDRWSRHLAPTDLAPTAIAFSDEERRLVQFSNHQGPFVSGREGIPGLSGSGVIRNVGTSLPPTTLTSTLCSRSVGGPFSLPSLPSEFSYTQSTSHQFLHETGLPCHDDADESLRYGRLENTLSIGPSCRVGGGLYPCRHCPRSLKSRSELRKHISRHTKPHKCLEPDCSRRFPTHSDLQRHISTIHRSDGLRWCCNLDGCRDKHKLWPRADNFRQHLKRVHKLDITAQSNLSKYLNTSTKAPSSSDVANIMILDPGYIADTQYDVTSLSVHGHDVAPSPPNVANITPLDLGYIADTQNDVASLFDHDRNITPSMNIDSPETRDALRNRDNPAMNDNVHPIMPSKLPTHIDPSRIHMAAPSYVWDNQDKILDAQDRSGSDVTGIFHGHNITQLPSGQTSPSQTLAYPSTIQGCGPPSNAMASMAPCLPDASDEETADAKIEDMITWLKRRGKLCRLVDRLGHHQKDQPISTDCQEELSGIQRYECLYAGCKSKFRTNSQLKKHAMRHTKPYRCTSLECTFRAGSKSDWVRHEQLQHEQQDTEFWCGFCQRVVKLDHRGPKERFNHIDDHYKERLYDQNAFDNWIPKPLDARSLGSPSQQDESFNPNTEIASPRPIHPASNATSSVHEHGKAPARSQDSETPLWHCCGCNAGPMSHVTTSCAEVHCGHDRCDECALVR